MKYFLFLIYVFFSLVITQETDNTDTTDVTSENNETNENNETTENNETSDTDETEYDELVSPCESAGLNVTSYSDCVGKSCEFIEEKCCFLESINITNGKVDKECVDICFYDYIIENRKQQMIKDIKNGTYWDSYDGKYQEILQLNCHQVFIYPYVLFIIILFFMWYLIFAYTI